MNQETIMNLFQKTLITVTSALSIGNSIAQDVPQTKPTVLTTEQKVAQCRPHLHRPENRDDLIHQMFQTGLLDDCLYSMPPEELQQIWDIPVVPMNKNTYSGADIASRLGFYIAHDIKFGLSIRLNKYSIENVGTLFPEGHYPKFMPEPSLISEADFSWGMNHNNLKWTSYRAKPNDQIQHGNEHIWIKDNRSIEPSAYMYGSIVALTFYNVKNNRFAIVLPQVTGFATSDTMKKK